MRLKYDRFVWLNMSIRPTTWWLIWYWNRLYEGRRPIACYVLHNINNTLQRYTFRTLLQSLKCWSVPYGNWIGAQARQFTIGIWARGLGGLQPPPRLRQNHYFWAKAKFFRQKPAAKNEKNVFIKRKTEFILFSNIKCPKFGIFTNNNTGLGESGKVN